MNRERESLSPNSIIILLFAHGGFPSLLAASASASERVRFICFFFFSFNRFCLLFLSFLYFFLLFLGAFWWAFLFL